MFDKWVLRDNDGAVFIAKRDDRNGEVVVGGHRRFRTIMEIAIESGLGVDSPENTHSQRGRIRLVIPNVRIEQWNIATRVWQEDWMAERKQRHGRLI